MIHHEIFPERIVGFNNLWIHFIFREFNCVSMSIIPCSLIQMESWARFLGDVFFPLPEEIEYSFLLYFGIVQIWLKGFEWEGLVCDYLFNSQRESHSVLDMDFFSFAIPSLILFDLDKYFNGNFDHFICLV